MRAWSRLRISSSSFSWIARVSRFCVYWSRSTSRKAASDVTVAGHSTQPPDQPKTGPVASQIAVATTALKNVHGEPTIPGAPATNLRSWAFMTAALPEYAAVNQRLEATIFEVTTQRS